jgi:hypothetical protein
MCVNEEATTNEKAKSITLKQTSIAKPTETLAMTEVNGTDNPLEIGGGIGNEKADAAWVMRALAKSG